jgi:phosphogluconate dehydratase
MTAQSNNRTINARIGEVTERIVRRSQDGRRRYLDGVAAAAAAGPRRQRLGCANQAHGFAACGPGDKAMLRAGAGANLAIVTA